MDTCHGDMFHCQCTNLFRGKQCERPKGMISIVRINYCRKWRTESNGPTTLTYYGDVSINCYCFLFFVFFFRVNMQGISFGDVESTSWSSQPFTQISIITPHLIAVSHPTNWERKTYETFNQTEGTLKRLGFNYPLNTNTKK